MRFGMRFGWKLSLGGGAIAAMIASMVACGSSTNMPPPKTDATAPGGSHDFSKWPKDDKSLCNSQMGWKDKPEFEVQETVGPGSIKPNVRRIYRWVGERENRKKVLVCREIDTNLDGIKDVVRLFDDKKGEAKHEESDTDYDGTIDVKVDFVAGRLAREEIDTKHGSTAGMWKPDVWKYYVEGTLSRVKRNTHCANGKPDIWEIYRGGQLERVGNDSTCDGHVDRWDRDTERILALEDQSRAAQAEAGAPQPVTVGLDGGLGVTKDAGKK